MTKLRPSPLNLLSEETVPTWLDGRLEKRISLEIIVSLTGVREPSPPEEALTLNVSTRGAQILTKRRWQPGDQPLLSIAASRHCCRARVVYCHPQNGSFCAGLELRPGSPAWWDGVTDREPATAGLWRSSLVLAPV